MSLIHDALRRRSERPDDQRDADQPGRSARADAVLATLGYARRSERGRVSLKTLFGYGIRISMQGGHLLVEDGIAADRSRIRLPRVGHGLKRLVVIGSDGMVSLASARWGEYLGTVHADHFAQTPDMKFIHPHEDFDPLRFYFRILENLARRGF